MIAGRELDALVAEKVMGEYVPCLSPYPGSPYQWFRGSNGAITSEVDIPRYSTSIEAAWAVVEKMGEKYAMELHWREGAWVCQIEEGDAATAHYIACAESFSAPLSICLAALEAVGVEVR